MTTYAKYAIIMQDSGYALYQEGVFLNPDNPKIHIFNTEQEMLDYMTVNNIDRIS